MKCSARVSERAKTARQRGLHYPRTAMVVLLGAIACARTSSMSSGFADAAGDNGGLSRDAPDDSDAGYDGGWVIPRTSAPCGGDGQVCCYGNVCDNGGC